MKKGIFDMVMTLYVLIGLVIILVGYGLLLVFVGNVTTFNQEQVIKANKMNEGFLALDNLLRTPVEFDVDNDNIVENINMIDLISIYQTKLDKFEAQGGGLVNVNDAGLIDVRTRIKEDATGIFDKIYTGKWNLDIEYEASDVVENYNKIEMANEEHKFVYLENRPRVSFDFIGPNGKMINVTLVTEYDVYFVGGIENE